MRVALGDLVPGVGSEVGEERVDLVAARVLEGVVGGEDPTVDPVTVSACCRSAGFSIPDVVIQMFVRM
ncbi:hypothetical protein A8711_22585 [Micromonospora sp. II]|nr:hypothetical protein A8711_22585 [Micromonospora sp. II]